jgi:hypothetical protein
LHQEEAYATYVLIKVESDKDVDVSTRIRELQYKYPIREVALLYGDYVLVKVEMAKPDDLESLVFDGLRPIQGVVCAQTLMGARSTDFR